MTTQAHEFSPIDWNTVYRVSARKQLATADHLKNLATICGQLPRGYSEFMEAFGFGYLDDLQFLRYDEILTALGPFRDSLNEWAATCLDAAEPEPIALEVRNNAVVLAKTTWGASYYCTPTEPGSLWYVPRSQDWESNPDFIPMAFMNPFVHKHPNGVLSHFGQDDLVFTPANARTQMRFFAKPLASPIDLESECRFVERYVHFDKRSVARYRVTYYCQSLSLAINCSTMASPFKRINSSR